MPLSQITILLGKNNSGKTAAARLPLLQLSGLAGHTAGPNEILPLRIRGLVYGSNLLELAYGRLPHAPFSLGFDMAHDLSESMRIDFSVQQRQSLKLGQSSFVSYFRALPYIRPIRWQREAQSNSKSIRYDDPDVVEFRGLMPVVDGLRGNSINTIDRLAFAQLRRMVHLKSIRAPIEPIYENRSPVDTTESTGGEVPFMLNADDDLMDLVSRWYDDELDLPGVGIEASGSAFSLTLRGATDEGTNIAQAGQGVQQVLPVVTYLIGMARGIIDIGLIVIEEPELHLHPAAHGAVADLAVDLANRRPSSQVILETHSENLVLRLRRRIAEHELRPEQLSLLWFDHSEKAGSVVRRVDVQDDGTVSSWPRGVFAEDLAEVQGIVRAGRS